MFKNFVELTLYYLMIATLLSLVHIGTIINNF